MRCRFQALGSVALLLTIAAAIAAAQVRVDVRLVNVVATVIDSRGRSIPNLKVDDFVLEEDGKPQQITHFSQYQNVPVSVGILLDTSGSMDRKMKTAVEAVDRFSRRIQQNDEILLITDGQDTASTAKLEDVLQSIRQSDVLIYPVGISGLTYAKDFNIFGSGPLAALFPPKSARTAQNKRDEVDLNVLRALAENSGGRAFLLAESLINRGGQIEKVLDTIADELRSQYTLGFYPARPDDGRYHFLRVRARFGNVVRARRGYLARQAD